MFRRRYFMVNKKNGLQVIRLSVVFLIMSVWVSADQKGAAEKSAKGAKAVLIISGHPAYPPVMWNSNSGMKGVGVELAKTICHELDIECDVRYEGPWKRVQEKARSGKIGIIAGLYMNNERKAYIDYTQPYMEEPNCIIINKKSPFQFVRRHDLIGKKGITIHGDSFGQELDEFIQSHLIIKRVYSTDALFKNLMTGRVDYVLWGLYPALANIAKRDIRKKVSVVNVPFGMESMHLGLSKKSGSVQYIKDIDRVINRLKSEGIIQQWINRFIEEFEMEARALPNAISDKSKTGS